MTISLRLGSNDHKDAAYISALIDAVKKNDGCFDEVWLATSYGLPSLAQAKEDAGKMAAAAQAFREADITASMQISRTVGHHESSLYNYPSGFSPDAFDCIADIDGESNGGVFCWNNAAFRRYWCEILPVYAGFQPTRIWIDDDIRLRLMGRSRALCFCDHCIALFDAQTGKTYDRASFKKAFIEDVAVRRAYIDFQVKTIGEFAHELFSALKKAAPQAIPCLQNGGATPLPIMAQKEILTAMKAASGFVPSFRAGGGFYHDHNPQEVLTKALTINYMNARIAPFAENLSCEIENLPHTAYGKSPEFTCIEGALYIAMGSNELSVTLMTNLEDLDFRALGSVILPATGTFSRRILRQTTARKTQASRSISPTTPCLRKWTHTCSPISTIPASGRVPPFCGSGCRFMPPRRERAISSPKKPFPTCRLRTWIFCCITRSSPT